MFIERGFMRKISVSIKLFFRIILWAMIIALVFLPVLMQWLCDDLFGIAFEEFVELVQAEDSAILLTVVAVTGIAMLAAGYTYSIFGIIASVISIVMTNNLYNAPLTTGILTGCTVLGSLLFVVIILFYLDLDFIANILYYAAVALRYVILFFCIAFVLGAVEMPAEFPATLRILFILGAVLSFLVCSSHVFGTLKQIAEIEIVQLIATLFSRNRLRAQKENSSEAVTATSDDSATQTENLAEATEEPPINNKNE